MIAKTKMAKVKTKTSFLKRNAPSKNGAYIFSNQAIILSLKLILCSVFLDKNMALIMGT